MADWRVLIVEDDPVVAGLHCRFVAQVPNFSPVGVAQTAAQTEMMLPTLRPDLILLDIGLPGEDGITLLRRIRAKSHAVEVIAVTAATSSDVVRASVQLGAVDYLVKPFDQNRLHQSLSLFIRRMAMLQGPFLGQDQVDMICSNGPNAYRWHPRDLSAERLRQVREVLDDAGRPLTAGAVAGVTGIARVTARRYLEYLVTVGHAEVDATPHGPGRPSKTYRSAGQADR